MKKLALIILSLCVAFNVHARKEEFLVTRLDAKVINSRYDYYLNITTDFIIKGMKKGDAEIGVFVMPDNNTFRSQQVAIKKVYLSSNRKNEFNSYTIKIF